jgi:hypothetical protein
VSAAPETERGQALFDLLWVHSVIRGGCVHLLEHLDFEEREAGPAIRRF